MTQQQELDARAETIRILENELAKYHGMMTRQEVIDSLDLYITMARAAHSRAPTGDPPTLAAYCYGYIGAVSLITGVEPRDIAHEWALAENAEWEVEA